MQRGLVVLLSFLAAVCAQTSYTVTLNFTGGLPICTQCGPAGQYACSPTSNSPQIGEWNNGTLKFQDPLPSGLYASGITAVVYGSYGCSAVGGTQAVLGLTLNEQVIDFHQGSSDSYCKCNTCGGGMVFSSNPVNPLSPTLPYYNNQGSNTLQLDVYASSVCISSVVITINATKAASNQITMVEFPLNFSDSDCNLACGPAYQCWCSSFSGDYLQTTFSDPLPENAVLLAAAVAIYGSARGSNPYNISTTLAGLTIGSSPVTWDTDDTICSGRIYLYDTDIYQNGWPGYTYGGQNTVNLLPGNNYRFCIGTFVLQLYYYTTPSLFL